MVTVVGAIAVGEISMTKKKTNPFAVTAGRLWPLAQYPKRYVKAYSALVGGTQKLELVLSDV